MKSKKLENLGLNFQKVTISRLKQTNGGAQAAGIEAGGVSKPSEKSCFCTYCDFHDC